MHKEITRPEFSKYLRGFPTVISIATITLVLGGCSTLKPETLTSQEIRDTSTQDKSLMLQDNAPLSGALSLDDAIARAIKYNAARRVNLMEEAVANGQLDVGRYDMMPKLVASAGYQSRDKDLITRSQDSVTGAPSLSDPYISSARSSTATDLSFTWSLLDFGQSYYASKQNADRVLIAEERRRKALHLLTQDVTTAFWRAASAQKLRQDVKSTIAAAEEALTDSRRVEAERLRNPLDALRYQRQLLENLRLLEAIDQELSTAKIELASLANIPLGQDFSIQESTNMPNTKWMDIPVERLEEQAILSNADLRETFYNARIAREETRRTLVRMFPGLSFSYALKGSDDSYLINKQWSESGVQISFNLLGLLSLPAQKRLSEAGVKIADQRRMATQMAVLTQLHIARLQYINSYRQFDRADAISRVDSEISINMAKREQAQTQTKLDMVANQTSAILSQLRRYQALAQVRAAASKLQATLGLDPVTEDRAQLSLPELSKVVSESLQRWDAGYLPEIIVPAPTGPIPPANGS